MSGENENENEDVVIHNAEVVGEAESSGDAPKARHYERSSPLPMRIREGSFQEEYLDANGEHVPYTSINHLALGVIDQMVRASELKKGPLQKMVKKITAGGEDSDSAKDRAQKTRQIYILDVFSDMQDQPFRFAASTINYKSFLDKVGYVSHHNFYRFCVHFARRVPDAVATTSTAAFLAKRRDKVAHFNDFHDFELEVLQQVRFDRDLVPISELDLSRDSWMDEWVDDEL